MKKLEIIRKLILIVPIIILIFTNLSVAYEEKTVPDGNQPPSPTADQQQQQPPPPPPGGQQQPPPPPPGEEINSTGEITDIRINDGYPTVLEIGEKSLLLVSIIPRNAKNQTITWESTNPETVSVDERGEIKALSPGKAQIIAKSENGKTSQLLITVKQKNISIDKMAFPETYITLKEGKELDLVPTISPDNATNKNLKWKSSDTDIAAVINGKVKAKKSGTVTITVTSDNNVEAQCEIRVTKKVHPPIIVVATIVIGLGIIGAVIIVIVKNKSKEKVKK